jgi:hypothetical protein
MSEPTLEVAGLQTLRASNFARYKAVIVNHVRNWHSAIMTNPEAGALRGIRVTPKGDRATSAEVLFAVCDRVMPRCFTCEIVTRDDQAFLRITGYDAERSAFPPYLMLGCATPRHRRPTRNSRRYAR